MPPSAPDPWVMGTVVKGEEDVERVCAYSETREPVKVARMMASRTVAALDVSVKGCLVGTVVWT